MRTFERFAEAITLDDPNDQLPCTSMSHQELDSREVQCTWDDVASSLINAIGGLTRTVSQNQGHDIVRAN